MEELIYLILVPSAFAVVVLFVVLKLTGISKRNAYEQDMAFLESCLKNFIVTESNFEAIERMFGFVERNNQDPIRTIRARNAFKKKYVKYFSKSEKIENSEPTKPPIKYENAAPYIVWKEK